MIIELNLDSHSAVVAVTHDPKLDDAALTAALSSDAAYIGASELPHLFTLGIRRAVDADAEAVVRHVARVDDLLDEHAQVRVLRARPELRDEEDPHATGVAPAIAASQTLRRSSAVAAS